jgi:hypothetical protein
MALFPSPVRAPAARIKLRVGAALTQFRPAATNIGEAIRVGIGEDILAPIQEVQCSIVSNYPSPSFAQPRQRPIPSIIIHNTFNKRRRRGCGISPISLKYMMIWWWWWTYEADEGNRKWLLLGLGEETAINCSSGSDSNWSLQSALIDIWMGKCEIKYRYSDDQILIENIE